MQDIWWGNVNIPICQEGYDINRARVLNFLNNDKEVFGDKTMVPRVSTYIWRLTFSGYSSSLSMVTLARTQTSEDR